jgi:hypothetical protein
VYKLRRDSCRSFKATCAFISIAIDRGRPLPFSFMSRPVYCIRTALPFIPLPLPAGSFLFCLISLCTRDSYLGNVTARNFMDDNFNGGFLSRKGERNISSLLLSLFFLPYFGFSFMLSKVGPTLMHTLRSDGIFLLSINAISICALAEQYLKTSASDEALRNCIRTRLLGRSRVLAS